MYNFLNEGIPTVNNEASEDKNPEDHCHVLSGIIIGDGPFHYHQSI